MDIREIDRDFKRVDGVELPMAIERDPKGRIPQVWRIARYELNPKGFDKAFREPASRGVS